MEDRRTWFMNDTDTERFEVMRHRRSSSSTQGAMNRMGSRMAVVQSHELSAEDRKLAEMGYEQVRFSTSYQRFTY